MGLDVYLYTHAQAEQNDQHEQEWEALYERKSSGEINEAEYDELSKKLTEYVSYTDVPSEQHPKHYCNRRYLRSSYNNSGFNHVVPDFLGEPKNLYWIFEPVGVDLDVGEHRLNGGSIEKLALCKQRALEVAAALRECDPLRVESISAMPFIGMAEHMWDEPANSEAALAWYREQLAERKDDHGGWSNARGTFMGSTEGQALHVLGAVAGTDVLRRPCVHLIYRATDASYYVEEAEIVAEFCDEAASLVERDGSTLMVWSG